MCVKCSDVGRFVTYCACCVAVHVHVIGRKIRVKPRLVVQRNAAAALKSLGGKERTANREPEPTRERSDGIRRD